MSLNIPKSGRKRILDDEQKLPPIMISEETQKTQNITKSRACAVGLASMHPHLYTSVLVVAYQALTEEARQLKIVFPGQDSNNAHRGIANGKTAL
ncbi:hypothetical protein NQ318_003886 [Aromia moschata]|uniref:Uncharacterized protein n=1 Tax=Aromia moschata TaxID=1265417 RepID=A0AAV8Z7Q4_9CUCU|nr:hypothetical protein NQ318_003886 [Aromia moschata]